MKRAIVYSRVSTEEQRKNNSPAAQEADGRDYCARMGFTVVDAVLESYTGATIDRPVFNRLLELADAGLIDAVIVQHPDRLGRDHYLQAAIVLLRNRDVEVHACNRGRIDDEDDETAQLNNSVDSLISGAERRNIRRRTKVGLVRKVQEDGKHPGYGSPPYGYQWHGLRKERRLVIAEEKAQYVRMIFNWYIEGVSVAEMCRRLESLRVPSPYFTNRASKQKVRDLCVWNRETIYKILRRETYAGTFIAFKQRRHGAKRPLHDISIPISVPAIIDRKTFDYVQVRLDKGKALSQRNAKRLYLLRAITRCSCGRTMSGKQNKSSIVFYYVCPARSHKSDAVQPCNNGYFKGADVEYTVWTWISSEVLNEENLRDGIAVMHGRAATERQRLEEQQRYVLGRITALEAERTRLQQLYLAELATLQDVARETARINADRVNLDAQQAEIESRLAGLGLGPEKAAALLDLVRVVKQRAESASDDKRRRILEALDTRITLYQKDGAPWCHIEVNLTAQSGDVQIESPHSSGS